MENSQEYTVDLNPNGDYKSFVVSEIDNQPASDFIPKNAKGEIGFLLMSIETAENEKELNKIGESVYAKPKGLEDAVRKLGIAFYLIEHCKNEKEGPNKEKLRHVLRKMNPYTSEYFNDICEYITRGVLDSEQKIRQYFEEDKTKPIELSN